MQKYQCHKVVEAAKIIALRYIEQSDSFEFTVEGGELVMLSSRPGQPMPAIGDYIVRYDGGYTSFSPADAFEAGYTSLQAVDPKPMLSNEGLEEALANSPAERVTKEQMVERIVLRKFTKLSGSLTHCQLQLDNGYVVTGESACVNVENYDQAIGEKIAFDNAFNKLWPLFGFLLAEKNLVAAKAE